ncbi:RQC domain-containing protein [Methanocella sp. MCL-LM]|uniref:RQC domain-containing protein n=1 Tax=Methanocella sp. MCL-LM TaxID=3412035 RepID=UPI003C78E7CF
MSTLDDFPGTADGSEQAKLILECIRQLQWPYGATHIGQVIAGKKLKKVLDQKHDQLPVFGTGSHYSAEQWKAWVNELVSQGYLTREPGLYPVITLNERSVEITDGLIKVQLSRPVEVKVAEPKPAEVKAEDLPATYDLKLYETLRIWRNHLAEEQQNPPYVILTNGDIKAICSIYPRSMEELTAIKGIGPRKAENYGEAILGIVSAHVSENGIVQGNTLTEAPHDEPNPWGSDPLEAAYNMQEYIQSLQDELKKTKEELEALYERIAASGAMESEQYRLWSEEKCRRSIDQALFYSRYPEIFLRNAKITLANAQKEIPPEALEPCIIREAHTAYKVEKRVYESTDQERP